MFFPYPNWPVLQPPLETESCCWGTTVIRARLSCLLPDLNQDLNRDPNPGPFPLFPKAAPGGFKTGRRNTPPEGRQTDLPDARALARIQVCLFGRYMKLLCLWREMTGHSLDIGNRNLPWWRMEPRKKHLKGNAGKTRWEGDIWVGW